LSVLLGRLVAVWLVKEGKVVPDSN